MHAAGGLRRPSLPAPARTALFAKKFDKKYDDAFDDFRTSGSMPSIPTIGEQYANAASYAREKGVAVDGDQETFGQRLTEAQQDLQRRQEESRAEYEEIKKELVADTAFVGSLLFACATALLPQESALSYLLGYFGSIAYAVLLTVSADKMGDTQGGMDTSQAQRFGLLVGLIIICAKNPETLQILPVLFGFFVPYKVASLRPAFTSLPPLNADEVRVFRYAGEAPDAAPFKVQYGANVGGRPRTQFATEGDGVKDMYVTGKNTPLGARNILTVEEQYERLKDGTLDLHNGRR
eukprot:Tamp_15225.p1 GENE.Tamp_15225~~Tamp_15225.p1  ORF type:complete len:307 (+),score=58.71 Tamp_15225:43-921(+)